MKAQFKVSSKLIVEVESDSQRSMFEELARIGEVFGQDKCQKCESTNIKFVVRNDKEENKYYSMDCIDCKARLSFGANKKGETLFVKKKDKEDKWIPNNGWQRWSTTTQSYE